MPQRPARLRVRRLTLLLVLLAGLLLPALTIPAARADEPTPVMGVGIRLVEVPTAVEDDPRARVYIIDHLAEGKTINRRVEVSNGTDDAMQVSMYSGAATLAEGKFVGSAGHKQNDLSGWTTTAPERLELEPRERAVVKVRVAVPPAAEPGERYGVVWAETRRTAKSGGVTQVSRVGIRVYLSIGTGSTPKSDFTILSMIPSRTPDGSPQINASVRNTGQRALDLSGSLRLTNGPAGLSGGPFAVSLGTTLAIGDTEPVLVVLDRSLPAGPWLAKITLRSGVTSKTARAELTFPDQVGQGAAVSAHSLSIYTRWIVAVAALLALALGVTTLLLVRKRRKSHSASAAREGAEHMEVRND